MGRCIIRVYKKGGRVHQSFRYLIRPPCPAPPRSILTHPHLEALLDQGGRGQPAQRPWDVALVYVIAAKHNPHNLRARGFDTHTDGGDAFNTPEQSKGRDHTFSHIPTACSLLWTVPPKEGGRQLADPTGISSNPLPSPHSPSRPDQWRLPPPSRAPWRRQPAPARSTQSSPASALRGR